MTMRSLFLAALALTFTHSFAQEASIPGNYDNGTNLNVLYRNEASGKLFASTRGFGILFRQAKHITAKTRSYYELEMQTLRHPKEAKSMGEGTERRRYVYGKVNSVLLIRGSVGLQNVLFSKGDHKAVEVRYAYTLGPTLALAKPYFVQIYRNRPGAGLSDLTDVRFDSENYSPDSGRVQGRSEFSKGLPGLKVYPGATAKFNLSFEYAPYTNLIRALETGICIDYFPKALPIMARNPAENLVITIHVGFVFGRKWF